MTNERISSYNVIAHSGRNLNLLNFFWLSFNQWNHRFDAVLKPRKLESRKAEKKKLKWPRLPNIYTKIMRKSKFNSSLCVSFPLSRIQSTCFASVFSSALTLTPFSRIFRCSQSNCAPAMADHPFFSLADARLCHLGHTPPLGMRHHHTMYQTSRLGHVTTWTVFIGKKEALVLDGWLACLTGRC